MGGFYIPGGKGGEGGGVHYATPPRIFTGATLAACRTARDTHFGAAGNAAELQNYQRNQYLAILLKPNNGNYTTETYLPGEEGQAYAGSKWVNRSSTTATEAAINALIAVAIRGLEITPVYTIMFGLATAAGAPDPSTTESARFVLDRVTIQFPEATEAHPSNYFRVPAGRMLHRIIWDGFDSTDEFTRSGDLYYFNVGAGFTQTYDITFNPV